eukprot:3563184-Amphidinium_carterae.1
MEPGSDEVSRETETEESRERSRSPSRPQSSGEYLVQKKTDEIKYEEIPLHLLQEFHEAMVAEATSMLETNQAMEVLSQEETDYVKQNKADR